MSAQTLAAGRRFEKRYTLRVALEAPVSLRVGGGASPLGEPIMGHATNVSRHGFYVVVPAGADFAPGQMVSFCLTVPWEWRRDVPFARMSGWARIVRVEVVQMPEGASALGMALAFCRDAILLGSLGAS